MFKEDFMFPVVYGAVDELLRSNREPIYEVQDEAKKNTERRFEILKVYEANKEVIDKVIAEALGPNSRFFSKNPFEEASVFFENYFKNHNSIFFVQKENYRISTYFYGGPERIDLKNSETLNEYFSDEALAKSFCNEYFLPQNHKRNLIIDEFEKYGDEFYFRRIQNRINKLKDFVQDNEEAMSLLADLIDDAKQIHRGVLTKKEYVKLELRRESEDYRYVMTRRFGQIPVEVRTDKVSIYNNSSVEYLPEVIVRQECVMCGSDLELEHYDDFGSIIDAICTNPKCKMAHILKPNR